MGVARILIQSGLIASLQFLRVQSSVTVSNHGRYVKVDAKPHKIVHRAVIPEPEYIHALISA